jgi:hypothetical protein
MSKLMQYINYIADPRARKSLLAMMSVGNKYETLAVGDSIPGAGSAGYAAGCKFILPNATLGMCPRWINIGSPSSALFVPDGPVLGYGFKYAGIKDATDSSQTDEVLLDLCEENDIPLVGWFAGNDADQPEAIVTAGKSFLQLATSADPSTVHDYQYAVMRNKCVPEWDIFAAGTHTTVGGDDTETITVTGAQAGDKALVCFGDTDDTDTIEQAQVSADTLTVVLSTDPSSTHVLNYVILRPRGSFTPSHYIAYAGIHTSVADAVATPYSNDIAVTGALTTDLPITAWGVTDDTDSIVKSYVSAAGILTCEFSANPLTAHKVNYALLRAY